MQILEGNYTVACCNGVINEEGLGFVSGKEVEVAPQSAPDTLSEIVYIFN